jgi:hypothetical protein
VARYIPIARRRRNAALVAVAALFLGIVLGWLVGKQSAPSVSSAVRDAQQKAADIAVQLERLPIEYQQAIDGGGEDSIQAGVIAPLNDIQASATNAFDDAPWISAKARAGAQDAIAEVRQAASDKVSADEFETAVNAAADAIRSAFGIEASSSP